MQHVFLVPHDPKWLDDFSIESSRVAVALGDVLSTIHHIGSTAISGICAKPIIDMLAVITDLGALDESERQMAALGYECLGELGIFGRRYFRKDDADGNRTHQIHAFQSGSPQIDRHLAFRDFMRGHSDCAKQYEALKLKLAEQHPTDISRYSEGKDDFIREMDARAFAWKLSGQRVVD